MSVFNQLLSNIVVNMQSLLRSSETAEQRPISERTRSQRRRQRHVCLRGLIVIVSGVGVATILK